MPQWRSSYGKMAGARCHEVMEVRTELLRSYVTIRHLTFHLNRYCRNSLCMCSIYIAVSYEMTFLFCERLSWVALKEMCHCSLDNKVALCTKTNPPRASYPPEDTFTQWATVGNKERERHWQKIERERERDWFKDVVFKLLYLWFSFTTLGYALCAWGVHWIKSIQWHSSIKDINRAPSFLSHELCPLSELHLYKLQHLTVWYSVRLSGVWLEIRVKQGN